MREPEEIVLELVFPTFAADAMVPTLLEQAPTQARFAQALRE